MLFTPFPHLGVNVDHVATIRQARHTIYPDPVQAALLCQDAGADEITVHLREDHRHIQERDVHRLQEMLQVPLNLEMAATKEMVAFACALKPTHCCLVPEKREELTTEGGLNLSHQTEWLKTACAQLTDAGIEVSLFIAPELKAIDISHTLGVHVIELHTGHYADATVPGAVQAEWDRLRHAAAHAHALGLTVNAGHGLHYHNVARILAIPGLHTLNIGHSIVARAVMYGLQEAVQAMKALIHHGG
ncbi:MAG: pyridoxine 5'-phosphate synthase [Gammaproteobacteria bacterium RIFCSPHIGHO2_12_FULL_45_9]|nr:MAG: pyridoxine 5'-phosphate synthase [Gammaproteobacteria bacterium RIFCSPHIGHO2_12_FULL_45_9]